MRIFYLALALAPLFFSCSSSEDALYDKGARGDLVIEFDHIVGDKNLIFTDEVEYQNALGQPFRVTMLKYYVSNFSFTKADGSEYTVLQDSSYFLVDESNPSSCFVRLKIPEGEYKAMRFIIGVDSLRNTMDISLRKGALDVEGNDMYWTWNSGYIFLKIEGQYKMSDADTVKEFSYHIGGFGGYRSSTTNNIQTIGLSLERGFPQVRKGRKPNIHLLVDISKMLNGDTKIDFSAPSTIHMPSAGVALSNNYARMITHDHTEN